MKSFSDTTGRTWNLTLTLGSAMAVKARLKVDLLQIEASEEPEGPPLLTRLGTDEMLLGEILCVMLENQFIARGMTDRDIRDAFDGPTLLAAQKAFYEELVDFFRSRGRKDRAAAVTKQMKMIDAAIDAVEQRIEAIDPRNLIHSVIENATDGATSGASLDRSDSTHES